LRKSALYPEFPRLGVHRKPKGTAQAALGAASFE